MIKNGLHKTLAEVGKIKTGMKGAPIQSKGGVTFQPPKKLGHFIVTGTERGDDGNLIEDGDVMAKLGKDPRELRIRLPFDSIDKNFFTQFQAYEGNKKICAGDGESATRRGEVTVGADKKLKVVGEAVSTVKCDFETCPIAQAGKCKVSGILSAFLPDTGKIGGVYKYRTHSWNGVSSILAALEFFAANTGGVLQNLPFKLVLQKKTTEDHGTIDYATIVLDVVELYGLRKLAIEERQSRLALGYDMAKVEAQAVASGLVGDTDAEGDVAAEFYVENEDGPQDTGPARGTGAEALAEELAQPEPTPAAAPVKPPVTELF